MKEALGVTLSDPKGKADAIVSVGCSVLSITGSELYNAGFSDDSAVKNWPANAGNVGSVPGPGRSRVPRDSKVMDHKFLARALELWSNRRNHRSEKPVPCN